MTGKIRVIVRKGDYGWIAQGLEADVCVQVKNEFELREAFDLTMMLEANEHGGIEKIGHAPKEYFDLWDKLEKPDDENFSDATYTFGVAA